MIPGGLLDAIQMSTGEFRFRYITPAGAEYMGPKLYKTRRAAKQAGEKWLAAQTRK